MKDGWIQMGSEEDGDIGEVEKEVGICETYLKSLKKKKEKQMSIKVGEKIIAEISV